MTYNAALVSLSFADFWVRASASLNDEGGECAVAKLMCATNANVAKLGVVAAEMAASLSRRAVALLRLEDNEIINGVFRAMAMNKACESFIC